ncbi:MAG: ABC transporter permease [Corallococcus sp.]|nr:ABC transporter permease [Corallococcus sp.]
MKKVFGQMRVLIERNIKLYFKEKMTFFLSLLSPLILLVLFLTFLRNVYESSLIQSLPQGFSVSDNLLNAFTGGFLFSSVLAVSCVSVSFCSNRLVDDKIKNVISDFSMTPISKSLLQTSYVISNFLTTLLVCGVILVIGIIYLAIVGWYLSFADIILILLDVVLTILFGTILMSIISLFMSSASAQGAVCTLVSSMYGFLCGAYMPIATMGEGIKAVVSFIPGTYGTVLFRKCFMNGVLDSLSNDLPSEAVGEIAKAFDVSFDFFGTDVSEIGAILVMLFTVLVLLGVLILLVNLKTRRHKIKKNK